ncbi:MAG: hypothetical protein DRJ50_03710 [Actinobacteria bacterium]|nr:MAG: hypothetical protein DRJ50_03710 [Actinomycetota bacterium]
MDRVGVVEMEELDTSLNQVAGYLNAQHAALVDLTIELLAHEEWWAGPGIHTPELYLAWRTGVSPERARQLVQIARRVDDLPVCLDKFRRGELAVDQMAAIARRAPWWTDVEIADVGSHMTVAQLRRTLGKYNFPTIPKKDDSDDNVDSPKPDPTAGDADDSAGADGDGNGSDSDADDDAGNDSGSNGDGDDEPEPSDRCSFNLGDDDRFWLNLNCDAESGMIIEKALIEARDALFRAGQTDVTWADALREMAERSLDTVSEPARRDRFRINVHLDTGGEAVDENGWRLPDAIRRYITCDGLITPVFLKDGVPVSVGRTQRIIPERTRRIVQLRDGGCRVPGCTQHRFIEVHHIVHWEHDGPTDTWNLIALCPYHHRLHHKGKLGICGNADQLDGVAFTNEHGNPIAQTGAKPEPPGGPPPTPKGEYEHPYGEPIQTRWFHLNTPPEHR